MKQTIVSTFFAACIVMTAPALAQGTYPERPIKLIVPYGPGGGTDITGRIVGDEMEKTLGQKIVVENKPGANGLIGLQELMSSKHDGYTLILANQTVNVIAPMLYPKQITFDVEKALVPIARLAEVPNVFAVNKDFPAKTFREFVDYAKKNPGKVRYTTTGVGSFPHFDIALLSKKAGLDLIHLPNSKGAAASVKDLATGDAQVGMMNVATAGPQVRGGYVRVLALADQKRHPDYPDTPTLAELGYPGIGTVQWFALLTHADAPPEAIKALHTATVKAVNSERVREAFRKQGITPSLTPTTDEARKWVNSEFVHWRQMLKDVPIQIER